MSLDEAYLDVTDNKMGVDDAVEIARQIKQEIFTTTRLTCSAGVSYIKFLAKIGSDLRKPDGLVVISPENAQEVLYNLPIGKFHGIGKVTAAKMQKLGIHNGADLHKWSLKELIRGFGKAGHFYYYVVRGIDNREIITEFEPKSQSCESTFHEDLGDLEALLDELRKLSTRLTSRLCLKNIQGYNVVLKLKYDNFEYITRSISLAEPSNDNEVLYRVGEQLLINHWDSSRKVRLLGLGVGKLEGSEQQDCGQLTIPL
jgi:DNA polymerase-4